MVVSKLNIVYEKMVVSKLNIVYEKMVVSKLNKSKWENGSFQTK